MRCIFCPGLPPYSYNGIPIPKSLTMLAGPNLRMQPSPNLVHFWHKQLNYCKTFIEENPLFLPHYSVTCVAVGSHPVSLLPDCIILRDPTLVDRLSHFRTHPSIHSHALLTNSFTHQFPHTIFSMFKLVSHVFWKNSLDF